MLFNELVPLCLAPAFVLDTMGDCNYGVHFSSCEDMVQHYYTDNNYSGVYVLKSDSDEESAKFFRVVEAIAKEEGGGVTVVCDEIDKFCNPHSIDPTLNRMIRYGRRDGINCIFACRRISEINPSIRAQVDLYLSFRQIEPGDIKALKDRSSRGAEVVKSLSLYRETGKHSEFVILGTIPDSYISLITHNSYISLESNNEPETLN